jgi:RHS repeat-associated protein
VTTLVTDLAGRITGEARPLGRVWSYEYDANGNRTKVIDANGNATPTFGDGTTTTAYDQLNRIKSIAYSDATPAVAIVYDGNGNRTQMTDGVTTTYTYDVNDHLTRVLRGTNVQLDFTYHAAGNRLTRTPLGGSAVAYAYDDDSRMASMVVGTSTTNYAYDPASHVVTSTLPAANGYVEARTYDRAGRLSEVKNTKEATTLSKSTYVLDNVGNPLSTVTTSGTITYTYDNVDRLTQACYTVACTAPGDNFRRYTYDAVGNRLTEVRDTGTTTYAYDELDELTGTTGSGGSVSYSYDQNGNTTSAGARVLTYSVANRTKTALVAGTTYTYTYDGDGNRVQTSTGTQANKKTTFQWDPSMGVPTLIRETDGSNSLLREYRYGRGLVSMQSGNASFFYHLDGLGSVVNPTSSSGATLWTEAYQPFGEVKTETKGSNQAPTNLRKLGGEYLDPTALYHLGARQYDPTSGRFLATDPVRPGVGNPARSSYGYADNRPTNRVDPTGLDSDAACVNFNFGAGPAQVSGELCVVTTTSGQGGITFTPGAGAGANLDISAGGGYQHSNADTVSDLKEFFGGAGGSASLIVGGYGNVFGGHGRCPGKIVNGFNAGVAVGGGASVSANGRYTWAIQLTGPPDPPCYGQQSK